MLKTIFGCAGVLLAGCAGPTPDVRTSPGGDAGRTAAPRIEKSRLEVALDPGSHRLEATATLTFALDAGPGDIRLKLHPDLWVDSITCAGRPVAFNREAAPAEQAASRPTSAESDEEADGFLPVRYDVALSGDRTPGSVLVVKYGGRLFQDVAAGERPGEIHNFAMRAHVGSEGIFLSEAGCWYPTLFEDDDEEAQKSPTIETALTQFELTAADVDGMTLVASGNRVDTKTPGRTTWRTPFPIEGLALVGGKHIVRQRQVDAVRVSVHLSEDHADFAPRLLDAVASYLKLYQPLLGPYPYDEFSVVENFFSSGFAYPGFTVLSSQVIAMGESGLRPGYLDHEMLHNWWGNGVFVSRLDGNWCECLTSYCANYMRPVLEGATEKARNQRRDICYGLSRLNPEKDKPLNRFDRKDGPGRFIGYQKGSMVFAMLADRIGAKTLWAALRRLYHDRLGRHADWNDIQKAVEAESRQNLAGFFDAWVRGSGLPDIEIDEARYEPRASRLMVAVAQRGGPFDVHIPIRLVYDNHTIDRDVEIDRPFQAVVVPSLEAPTAIELDPDFRVMRRIEIGDIMPTISGLVPPDSLNIVRDPDDFAAYDDVAERFRKRYEDSPQGVVHDLKTTGLTEEYLAHGHALMLGRACEQPIAATALEGSPLSIGRGYFKVGETRYDKPTDAVLCNVRNKQDPGAIMCFYYGNSEAALKKAGWITFYGGDSLIVFDDGKPVRREDFEHISRIAVQQNVAGEHAPRAGMASDSTGQGDRVE